MPELDQGDNDRSRDLKIGQGETRTNPPQHLCQDRENALKLPF